MEDDLLDDLRSEHGDEPLVIVTVASDHRHDAEFIRRDKAGRYFLRLLHSFPAEDILISQGDVELDPYEDLGLQMTRE